MRTAISVAMGLLLVGAESVSGETLYTATPIGPLPGGATSMGTGINNSGQVAGTSEGTIEHAFLYRDGAPIDVGSLPGGSSSVAYAINNLGQVTGGGFLPGGFPGTWHAFIYSAGALTDLGMLGGLYAFGYGINDSGEVVGQVLDLIRRN